MIGTEDKKILELYLEGCTTKEIAGMVFLSYKTILNRMDKLREKFKARSRINLFSILVKKGLIMEDRNDLVEQRKGRVEVANDFKKNFNKMFRTFKENL